MLFRYIYFWLIIALPAAAATNFTVATFNVENYFLSPYETRKKKAEVSREKVSDIIMAVRPDVLALQEMGRKIAFDELRNRLSKRKLEYRYHLWLEGPDPAIHLALLSRFPIVGDHSKTNVIYLLDRKRFQVSRGFMEVSLQVNQDYSFTLINAHLKSKRAVAVADQAEMRLEEARALRRLVDKRLTRNPKENLLLVGDLNDSPANDPIRALIGRGSLKLLDLRPIESIGKIGGSNVNTKNLSRDIVWTYFYKQQDQFSRFDYILASQGIRNEYVASFVKAHSDWGVASDHRIVVAKFAAKDH